MSVPKVEIIEYDALVSGVGVVILQLLVRGAEGRFQSSLHDVCC